MGGGSTSISWFQLCFLPGARQQLLLAWKLRHGVEGLTCPLAPFWVDSSGLIHRAQESRGLWMELLLPWLRRGQWTKPASCRWICVAVARQLTAGKNLNPALAAHFRGDETMPGVFICGNNGKSLLCKSSTRKIYLKHAFVRRDINGT